MIRNAIRTARKRMPTIGIGLRGKSRVLEDAETKLMRAVDAIVGSVSGWLV